MIVKYDSEMFDIYMNYFANLIDGYMQNKEEDIFMYLLRKLKESLRPSISKILYSLQFLSFYYGIEHVKKTKVASKREDVLKRMEEFKELLIKFLESPTFPNSIVEEHIYSTDVIKNEYFILDSLPKVHDNPDKLLNGLKKELNKVLIKSIIDITSFLDSSEILDGMLEVANFKSKKHYLAKVFLEKGEPIKVDLIKDLFEYLREEDKIIAPKNVYEIFSYKYLETLKTQDLVFMNLYWCNKYAKVIENFLFYAMFFANRKSLLYGVKNKDISKDTIIHFINEDLGGTKTEVFLFEIKKYYENTEYVSKSHDMDDLRAILPVYDSLAISYILKDLCIFSAFETEGEDKSIKNYGIVETSQKNEYTYAFCWDIPHMNLPITVHCSKECVHYYYKNIRKDERIRVYAGFDDFFSKGNIWKNSFLFPVNADKIEYIKNQSKLNNQLKHVLFLQTGIWPEHMRENGKVKKRYISLDELTK